MVRITTFYFISMFSIMFPGIVFSGTVENAEFIPETVQVYPGDIAQVRFNAINDNSFALKSYSILLRYNEGLDVSNLITTPTAKAAKIDTRKQTVSISWSNLQAGAKLNAYFEVSSNTISKFIIVPEPSKYTDTNRNNYTGTCNSAVIRIVPELSPPTAPTSLKSKAGISSVHLSWTASQESDVAGYRIYRRTSDTEYDFTTSVSSDSTSYVNTGLSPGTIYSYLVTAMDKYGNESTVSKETTSSVLEDKLELLTSVSKVEYFRSVKFGNFYGDNQTDLVANNGFNKITIYKDGKNGKKTKIELSSPDEDTGQMGSFGSSMEVVDLNNDGYDDLVVSDVGFHQDPGTLCGRGTGKVYVFAGGPGFPGDPVIEIQGTSAYLNEDGGSYRCWGERLGRSLDKGDINSDGYKDIIIGIPFGGIDWGGEVGILFGGPSFSSSVRYIPGPDKEAGMGGTVKNVGDLNGDGYNDIITISSSDPMCKAVDYTYLILGGTNPHLSAQTFNSAGIGGKDINNDGYSDLFVNSDLYIYEGVFTRIHSGASFLDNNLDYRFEPPISTILSKFDDFNQDSYGDILTQDGTLFWGSANGLTAPVEVGSLGIYDVGDFNGDGVEDIITSSEGTFLIYSLSPLRNLPEIHVIPPKTKSITYLQSETVTGTVKGTISKLLIGGEEVAVNADNSFHYTWPLVDGNNILEVVAVTPENKMSKATLNLVKQDASPLTLTIDYPEDEWITGQTSVLVSGTVSESLANVTVNDTAAPLNGNAFQLDVPLIEVSNTITVEAIDYFDRTISQTITVYSTTKGSISGVVQDTSNQPLADVNVTVQEEGGASFSAVTGADGSYFFPSVSQGNITLTFQKASYITEDVSGTITAAGTLLVNVQQTEAPPLTVEITSPLDGVTGINTPVIVSGIISNSSAMVLVSGVPADVSNNTFQANVNLTEGINTIIAVAEGPYEQSASDTILLNLVTTGDIKGKVTVNSTGLPIEDALVNIIDSKGTNHSVSTDVNGDYLFNNFAGGDYSGSISKTGYQTDAFAGTLTPAETLVLNRQLLLPPTVISNVTVVPTENGATVSWLTDQPADSTVEYGTTDSYDQSISNATLQVNHSLSLSGLDPSITYHYRVMSTNSDGSTSQSSDATFTTLALPVITDISVSNITGNSAVINWITNIPTDSFIEYGETSAYGSSAEDLAQTTTHSVELSGLISGKTYHFCVYSTSDQGVSVVSGDNQFNTLQIMSLTITSPINNDTIFRKDTQVKGTITHSEAVEFGVVVNGIIAILDGNQFTANHLPLKEGENTITAMATDISGNVAITSHTVTMNSSGDHTSISSFPESGVTPLEATIKIDATFAFSESALLYTGPDAIEFISSSSEEYKVRITTPGVYYFTVEVTDEQAIVRSDSMAIEVLDPEALNTLLKTKWNSMKSAMVEGNIELAGSYFIEYTRENYKILMQEVADLSSFAIGMADIHMIYFKQGIAKYRIQRTEDVEGVPTVITYHIYFRQDVDGIYKVYKF